MEETQPTIDTNAVPEKHIKPSRPWRKIVLFTVLGLVLTGGLVFAGIQVSSRQIQVVSQLTPTPRVVATLTPETVIPTQIPLVTSTLTPTPILESIVGWKTISDKDNGYHFRIPLDWETYLGRKGTDRFIRPLSPFEVEISGEIKKISADMIVEVCKPPPCAIFPSSERPAESVQINLDGYLATKETFISEDSPWKSKKSFRIIVGQEQRTCMITWQDASPIFDQILSTFKFLE